MKIVTIEPTPSPNSMKVVVDEASSVSAIVKPLRLRPNTWMVPLSLETANQSKEEENAMLNISALSTPRRTCHDP